jgi:hypothetical protein
MTVTVKIVNVPRKQSRNVKVTKKKARAKRMNESIVLPGESRTEDLSDGDSLLVEAAEVPNG